MLTPPHPQLPSWSISRGRFHHNTPLRFLPSGILVTCPKYRSCDLFVRIRSGSTFTILLFILFLAVVIAPLFCNSNDQIAVTRKFIIGLQMRSLHHSFSLDYSVHPCNRDTFNYLCFCWNKDLRRSRTIKIVRCYKSFISHENYRLVVINSSVQRSNFFFQMQNSFHSASHKLFNKRHHVKSLKRIFKHRTISL